MGMNHLIVQYIGSRMKIMRICTNLELLFGHVVPGGVGAHGGREGEQGTWEDHGGGAV